MADRSREYFRQPRLIVAVVCGVAGYSMMNLVMTSAPVAMLDCHLTHDDAILGLQWHVVRMSRRALTGALIARFGTDRVAGVGLAIIATGALIALAGIWLWNFWAALILLGVGWNFAFVGATALVAQCHRPNERNKVQAVNDFLVFGSMAIGSFASGKLLASYGWDMVAEMVLPSVGIAGVLSSPSMCWCVHGRRSWPLGRHQRRAVVVGGLRRPRGAVRMRVVQHDQQRR